MKHKIISIIGLMAVALAGCGEKKIYKRVVKIDSKTETFNVTVTEQHGGNAIGRAAGGALIGGGVNWLLGGKFSNGAIIGGAVGAGTAGNATYETRNEKRTQTTYWVKFSDSSQWVSTNYCPFRVGDSVEVDRYKIRSCR